MDRLRVGVVDFNRDRHRAGAPPGFEPGLHYPGMVDPKGTSWMLTGYGVGPVAFDTAEDEAVRVLIEEFGPPDTVVLGGCELGGPFDCHLHRQVARFSQRYVADTGR